MLSRLEVGVGVRCCRLHQAVDIPRGRSGATDRRAGPAGNRPRHGQAGHPEGCRWTAVPQENWAGPGPVTRGELFGIHSCVERCQSRICNARPSASRPGGCSGWGRAASWLTGCHVPSERHMAYGYLFMASHIRGTSVSCSSSSIYSTRCSDSHSEPGRRGRAQYM